MTVWNFGAGPAVLPSAVLEQAQSEFMNFHQTAGMSLLEMSHRSKEFAEVLREAKRDLCELLAVPETHQVVFMQGGATLQFACVALNLVQDPAQPVDYLITGVWSQKAAEEARKLLPNGDRRVNVVVNTKKSSHDGEVGDGTEWQWSSEKPSYVYYCDNETVHGVEWDRLPTDEPSCPYPDVPLVCDMSSNILSRPVDVSRFALIFAGAQKNIGPAGVTVLIIRKDMLERKPCVPVPTMLDYQVMASNDSLYNTPPTFAIYLSGLVFRHMLASGGMPAITKRNALKADKLYKFVAASKGFYRCTVNNVHMRSRMNVPLRIVGKDGSPDEELEKSFLSEAEERKGHRSVGGLRVSMYNAMEESGVDVLLSFMNEFQRGHQQL